MNGITDEWLAKAEGDFVTANREFRARKLPNYDSSCFHAQQCAEKYLKAFLQERQIVFPKTHSLIVLLELCVPVHPAFELYRGDLIVLDRYGVRFRYPGDNAIRDEAKTALICVMRFRAYIRNLLGFTE